MPSDTGKYIIIVGLFIVAGGIVIYFFGDKPYRPGQLPGDTRIGKANLKIEIPVTCMILQTVIVSRVVWLVRNFFQAYQKTTTIVYLPILTAKLCLPTNDSSPWMFFGE